MVAPATRIEDERYTIDLEHCGYATPRYVLRFCGKWVSQHEFMTTANISMLRHQERRTQ